MRRYRPHPLYKYFINPFLILVVVLGALAACYFGYVMGVDAFDMAHGEGYDSFFALAAGILGGGILAASVGGTWVVIFLLIRYFARETLT